jgi:hypothetical protein
MSRPDTTENGRAARLAEALRENLRKRKVQARARNQAEADRTDGTEPAAAETTRETTTRRDGADRPQG